MNRGNLSHEQWKRLKPLLPPQKPKTGRPTHDHRRIQNGILWILRTGAPWGDLPERFQRLATRYEKRAEHYRVMWVIAAIFLWS